MEVSPYKMVKDKRQKEKNSFSCNFSSKSRKAAMEMSVGTLVTIVLLMVVLVMGIILIRSIFGGSEIAIENINNQVINEINNLFSDQTTKIAIAPSDRAITLNPGSVPKGFAFSIRNNGQDARFTYAVTAQDTSRCEITPNEANGYLLPDHGQFELAGGEKLPLPIIIKFVLPETMAPCTMTYALSVERVSGGNPGNYIPETQVFVTIK